MLANHRALAYFLMRLAIGVNIFGHGFFRILAGVGQFATGMAQKLDKSPLPHGFVLAFGYCIPWIELCLGILLIVGLLTRFTLAASAFFIVSLTFGTVSNQDWGGAGTQLLYSVVFFFMLWLVEENKYSVDGLMRRDS